jgi:hypothetical protein
MKPNKWIPIALILILGLVVVVIVMGFSIKNISLANPKSTEDWRMKEIRALEQELQNPNLTGEDRKLLEDKIQVLFYPATLQAEGVNQLTTMPTQAAAALQTMAKPAVTIVEQDRTGIIENPSVPFSQNEVVINNAWKESVNGKYIIVFAGASAKDIAQGILVVCSQSNHECRFISAPQKNGSLRVVGYKNSRLIVRQEKTKQDVYFDVPTSSFTKTIDEIVTTTMPTLNGQNPPLATGTPYPQP